MAEDTERLNIVRLVQTSIACPSQWDAWTDTGQYIYIRYRFGRLTVESFPDEKWYKDISNLKPSNPLLEWRSFDGMDGFMSFEELKDCTKGVLSFDNCDVKEMYDF